MNLSLAAFARFLGICRTTVDKWVGGTIGVPRPIALLVRILAAMPPEERARWANGQIRVHGCD